MASSVAPRKRSECMLTECAKSVQTTLKPADPTLLQTISSYARRELGPPVSTVNETVLHSSTASSSNCSSGASQLLHAVRHAARNAFNCEQSNFFTVDHSLAEQRLSKFSTLNCQSVDFLCHSKDAAGHVHPISVDFRPRQSRLTHCFTLN
ncbi:hypothetical protein FGIG_05961 [Fasciola gigantica]|uniref:Uncharacterized protein n=1 Tax=Fasciola gigantica TaxID=46835 RepID=A0A504Z371_FASGI|nr:hypothetical protein FGIG_05961 [Fasciola gigantica]